jgi:hypothetical protein
MATHHQLRPQDNGGPPDRPMTGFDLLMVLFVVGAVIAVVIGAAG